MMPLTPFASGPYTATYNADRAPGPAAGKSQGARDLGIVQGVRRWKRTPEAIPVTSSLYGDLVIDGIYQGAACFCQMTFKQWSSATRDALWPFSETFAGVGPVGSLLTAFAGELVLTAVPDTPASHNGPGLLRFRKAIVAPDSHVEIPMGDVERDIDVTFRCFPYVNNQQDIVWFEEE